MNFWASFHPAKWSKLSYTDRENSDDLRRDILFSQILVIGIAISILHFLNDLINGNSIAYIMDFIFIALLVVFYILNEKGAHRLAKILDLTVLNILIFLLASILDERIRMSYNFFPLAILSFLIFYKNELFLSIIFSTFSIMLLITLELADFQPFGDIGIKEGVDNVTLFINIVGSFVLMVMGLVFLVKLNRVTEHELRQKEFDLQKSNQELDRFVYSVSHDLRAPLSSIKGLANLMKYETKDAQLMDYISKIDHRVLDLEKFINELIDQSRNSRTEVVREDVNIEELIGEILEKLKYMQLADNIELRKKVQSAELSTDRSRLAVILSNLISNAIKYSDKQKESKWIEVATYQQNGSFLIEVNDNGIGIDTRHHKDIYNMFYRADKGSDGSGLGLYIVKEMVHKLDGEIDFESSYGEGTRFSIKLPNP